jgi:transaldolase
VRSVQEISHHCKRHAIRTEVMAASFRNTGQIATMGMTRLSALTGKRCSASRRAASSAATASALSMGITFA